MLKILNEQMVSVTNSKTTGNFITCFPIYCAYRRMQTNYFALYTFTLQELLGMSHFNLVHHACENYVPVDLCLCSCGVSGRLTTAGLGSRETAPDWP